MPFKAIADERRSISLSPFTDGPDAASGTDEEMNELDVYEQERLKNIKDRDALLASLGLSGPSQISGLARKTPPKLPLSSEEARRKRELKAKDAAMRKAFEPIRRSGRLAARDSEPRLVYTSDPDTPPSRPRSPSRSRTLIPKATAPTLPPGPIYSPSSSSDLAPAPRPERGEDGRLVFEGRWKDVFTPNLTPEEMFEGGAFGGGFFADTYSQILRSPLASADDLSSLPFTSPSPGRLLNNPSPDGTHNRFKVRAGQSLQEWEKAGWIWAADPRGWAQWYVRFWEGRRCEDDERQVRRWLKVAGPTGRFKRALLKKLVQSGGTAALADEDVGAVLRQCLWQWGYEMTPVEFERAMNGE